jgi:transcriptional regulator with XRE-family HTH domain
VLLVFIITDTEKPMTRKHIPEHNVSRLLEISSFIRNWRLNEGLSQSEFSQLAGIHTNTLIHLESGRKQVTLRVLFACLDAMDGISLDQFFQGIQ